MAEDFAPGEVVTIAAVDPLAEILYRRAWPCRDCGGPVYHCALVETGEHVDLCVSVIKRRPN